MHPEFEKLAERLEEFPLIYFGNLERDHHTNIPVPMREWIEEKRRQVASKSELLEKVLATMRVFLGYANSEEYRTSNNVTRMYFREDKDFFGDVVLEKGTLPFHAQIRRQGNEWEFSYLGNPDQKTTRPPGDVHAIRLRTRSEIRDVEPGRRIAIYSPDKLRELEEIIEREFHTGIQDIHHFRSYRNKVHQLVTSDDQVLMIKEYADPENLSRESFFMQCLFARNLAPSMRTQRGILISQFLGSTSLADVTDETELGKYYDQAVDIILAIERLPQEEKIGSVLVRTMDDDYFLREFRQQKPHSTKQSLMNRDFYPLHGIVTPSGLRTIDCEQMFFGPIEYALATLLVNTFHTLPPAFMEERLDRYLAAHPELRRETLFKSFQTYAMLKRSSLYQRLREKPGDLFQDHANRARTIPEIVIPYS
jgi:hypothetical protein